jgi:pSer/pThr/pTyr-binding forkhead associated (FHA) protein
MARMILSLNGRMLAEYNLSKERYTVGRLPDNDIRIDNPAVSGHHSLIINILNDSFLEDLNSTNGTYVNGKLIKKHALAHGDVITVGHHQLRFVEDGMEEAPLGLDRTLEISTAEREFGELPASPDDAENPVATAVLAGTPAPAAGADRGIRRTRDGIEEAGDHARPPGRAGRRHHSPRGELFPRGGRTRARQQRPDDQRRSRRAERAQTARQ